MATLELSLEEELEVFANELKRFFTKDELEQMVLTIFGEKVNSKILKYGN